MAVQHTRRYSQEIEYEPEEGKVRIGVIVPFDFALDWEYWRAQPSDVSLHFTRTPHLRRAVGLRFAHRVGRPTVVRRAARAVSSVAPDVALYACSSGSFVEGPQGERALRRAMLDGGSRRAVTASSAMVDSIRAIGARRVAVAAPYTRPLVDRLLEFLAAHGIEVVSACHLGLDRDISRVSRHTVVDLVRASADPQAEAVFVACTALPAHGRVAALEQEIDRPVLTANQASIWAAIREADPALLHPGWGDPPLGGGDPMARSTRLLLEHRLPENRLPDNGLLENRLPENRVCAPGPESRRAVSRDGAA